jgi:hypothetical protein
VDKNCEIEKILNCFKSKGITSEGLKDQVPTNNNTVQLKRENILMNNLEGISTVLKNTFVRLETTQYRCWIFSWAMSHIGATNQRENIVIRYVSVVSLSPICT